jgi:hypothetical protein
VSAIQDAPLVTAHVQSRVVVIVSVPDVPAAGADETDGLGVTWHLTPDGESTVIDDDPQAAATHASVQADSAIHKERPDAGRRGPASRRRDARAHRALQGAGRDGSWQRLIAT